MAESAENCVRLPDDSPAHFNYVVHWLYFGRSPIDIVVERNKPEARSTTGGLSKDLGVKMTVYCETYLLADRLMLESLQNHIIDRLREVAHAAGIMRRGEPISFERVPKESGLFLLLKQQISHLVRRAGAWLKWKNGASYKEFAVKSVERMEFVTDALAEYPDAKRPNEVGHCCDLHTHVDTPKCINDAAKPS
jgi:hypothetical protein